MNPTTKIVVANVTSTTPEFQIYNLSPGFDYMVYVFAVNEKGKSKPYLLEGFSLKVAENRMGWYNLDIFFVLY